MQLITSDPTVAFLWWQDDQPATILTNGVLYKVAPDLEPDADWRMISPEEIEELLKEQAC